LGLALWSAATISLGFVTEFTGFLLLRILLGIGESVAFPCSSKLLAFHVEPGQLGKANGLISTAMGLGPAFGTMVGGLVLVHFGWSQVFVLFGSISLLWLLPWRHVSGVVAAQALMKPKLASPPLLQVARCRDLWGAVLGHFCMNYAFYFILSWLPLYLIKGRGLSIEAMAQTGGIVFMVFAASGFVTGMVTDRLIQGGLSINRVRKTFVVSAHALIALCLVLTGVGSVTVALGSLLVAGVALGMGMPNVYAIGQTLAGPRAGGKWMGIQNSLANCAGIIAPVVTGTIADRTGNYALAFFIAAAVVLTGTVGWGLVVRKVETTDWNLS
jgi:MFS family permease